MQTNANEGKHDTVTVTKRAQAEAWLTREILPYGPISPELWGLMLRDLMETTRPSGESSSTDKTKGAGL